MIFPEPSTDRSHPPIVTILSFPHFSVVILPLPSKAVLLILISSFNRVAFTSETSISAVLLPSVLPAPVASPERAMSNSSESFDAVTTVKRVFKRPMEIFKSSVSVWIIRKSVSESFVASFKFSIYMSAILSPAYN